MPSVLWRCWLGGRKDIRPVKNWVMGCWNGYLSGARCRLTYGPADATATHFLLIGFTFLVPAHPGSPEQRAVKRVCVCAAWQTTLVKKRFHHYYWAVKKICTSCLLHLVCYEISSIFILIHVSTALCLLPKNTYFSLLTCINYCQFSIPLETLNPTTDDKQ